jgi:hypothetical protein
LRYGWQTCAGLDERRVVTLPLLLEGLAVGACRAWFKQTFGHEKARLAFHVIRIDDPVWQHDLERFRETAPALTEGLAHGDSPDRPAWQWCMLAVVDGTAEWLSGVPAMQATSRSTVLVRVPLVQDQDGNFVPDPAVVGTGTETTAP